MSSFALKETIMSLKGDDPHYFRTQRAEGCRVQVLNSDRYNETNPLKR
jgi:hypothetical protein